jgi:ABC-type Na+ efflux pump permease subunit
LRSPGGNEVIQVPSFQDRVGRAQEAKQKALESLLLKPGVDDKVAAERRAARLKREAVANEKRSAKKAAEQAAREAKAATSSARAEAASKAATVPVPPTEAERKLARDARYAARKNRK